MRLDQWLWAVRVFKSRTLAADAVKAGRALVNGQPCKPAHEVRAGEVIAVRIDWDRERTLRVLGAPPSRVGAKRVAEFAAVVDEAAQPREGEAQQRMTTSEKPFG